VSLTKRDIFFFLERLSEQTVGYLKYQYKKQYAIFRNFKINGGNVKLTNYVLQTTVSYSGISRVVEIYSLFGQVFYNYAICPLQGFFTVHDIKSLQFYNSSHENTINQDVSRSFILLNTYNSSHENTINQDVSRSFILLNTYNSSHENTINQDVSRSFILLNTYNSSHENTINQDVSRSFILLNTLVRENQEDIQCLVNYTIARQ
jgi:hypothetical protein